MKTQLIQNTWGENGSRAKPGIHGMPPEICSAMLTEMNQLKYIC